jgi:hypothetical protein
MPDSGAMAACAVQVLAALAVTVVAPAQPVGWVETPMELRGSSFLLRHPPRLHDLAVITANAFPEAHEHVRRLLGSGLAAEVEVDLVGGSGELARLARARGVAEPASWVAGLAVPGQRWIALRSDLWGGPRERIAGLLRHEISHVAAHDRAQGRAIPRWFDEGVAQLAEGRLLREPWISLPARAFFGTLIPMAELDARFAGIEGAPALAYAQAESFTRFLERRLGERGLGGVLADLAMGFSFSEALTGRTGWTLDRLEAAWRSELRRERGWIPGLLGQFAMAVLILGAVLIGWPHARRRRIEERARMDAEAAGPSAASAGEEPGAAPGVRGG